MRDFVLLRLVTFRYEGFQCSIVAVIYTPLVTKLLCILSRRVLNRWLYSLWKSTCNSKVCSLRKVYANYAILHMIAR